MLVHLVVNSLFNIKDIGVYFCMKNNAVLLSFYKLRQYLQHDNANLYYRLSNPGPGKPPSDMKLDIYRAV